MKNLAVGRIMMGNVVFPLYCRTWFKMNDDKRDAGLTVPENVSVTADLHYGSDPQQVLDVYKPLPLTPGEALPVIISIHGGGYVYGDKERYSFYCMDLALRGFAVINFSYRLAPKHKYPAQLHDVANCVSWCMKHAEKLGIDPQRVFFVGDSAGAQMLSQYAAAYSNPSYAELLGLTFPEMDIRAIALNCGLYHLSSANPAMKSYLSKEVWEYGEELRVAEHITADFPPTFVMSAYGDGLFEDAFSMNRLLTKIGIENELHIYGTKEAPPGHVFHLNIRDPEAVRCNDEECGFFRKHL